MSTSNPAEAESAGAPARQGGDDGAPATGPAPSISARLEPQRVTAGYGTALVNEVIREVCGDAAASSPSAAEGLALVGGRAANLLDPALPEPADALEAGRAPWVYHHIADGSAARLWVGAVELIAHDHQSAVDHALAAHAIAEAIGRPVTCRIDRRLAGTPGLARLPVKAGLDELFGGLTRGSARPTPEVVSDRLSRVAERLGRPLATVTGVDLPDCELAVVALGSAVGPARAAVARLRAAGLRVGLAALSLLRPLPRAELATLLGGVERLALVVYGGDDEPDSALAEFLEELTEHPLALIELRQEATDGPAPPDEVQGLVRTLAELVDGGDPSAYEPAAGAGPAISVASQPGGAWGRDLLFELAATLGRITELRLGRPAVAPGLTSVPLDLSRDGAAAPARIGGADLLVVAHPSLLDPAAIGDGVRPGATVVIETESTDDDALLGSLTPSAVALIEARELSVWRVDARSAGNDADQPARAARVVLIGAALAALAESGQLDGAGDDVVERIVERLARESTAATSTVAQWLHSGAAAVERIEIDAERAARARQSVRVERPRRPEGPDETAEDWSRALRRFHLNGERARGWGDPTLGLPLTPAALRPVLEAGRFQAPYPFYLSLGLSPSTETGDDANEPGGPAPLLRLLEAAVTTASPDGSAFPIAGPRLPLLNRVVGVAVAAGAKGSPRELLAAKRSDVLRHFDVSEEGGRALAKELDAIEAGLPADGVLVGLDEATPLRLYLAAMRSDRRPRLAAFVKRAGRLLERVDQRLQSDRLNDPNQATPDALSGAMGIGGALFDASALAQTLKPPPGTRRLTEAQRSRLESVQGILGRVLRERWGLDSMVLVHADALPADVAASGLRTLRHGNPLAAAIGVFDGLAAGWLEIFKATRVARLELETAYEPEVHDALLADFGWSSCTAEELALLPAVVAIEAASRVHRSELASFGQLLDSGRPVHALLIERTPGRPGDWPGDLGRTAVAHGEAFVLQSTVSRPAHLMEGFARMARLTRPAVALVASPPEGSTVRSEILGTAALEGRATPCFRFDPDAGRDFADRFDLEGNPAVGQGWSSGVLVAEDEASGQEVTLDTVFTWADAVALHDASRRHFWAIPPRAWSDEQVELAEVLARGDVSERRSIPYIWVVDADERLQRAVLTRELLVRALDRQRAWHALQELGGIDNAFARRAAEEARAAAETEAEARRVELEATLREEIEQTRTEAAGEAIDRLVAALLELDTSGAAALTTTPAAAPAARPAPAAPAAEPEPAEPPEPAEEDEDDLAFDQPYIDAFLCTTCNECTNLNPVMFQYNSNKQAEIVDAEAGTFAELVQAAEKCPARCIHPGKPRAGDPTVTDELIERAAPFS